MPPQRYPGETIPKGLSRDDVRLLATTEGDRPHDMRARAILMLLITYGLRAGELAAFSSAISTGSRRCYGCAAPSLDVRISIRFHQAWDRRSCVNCARLAPPTPSKDGDVVLVIARDAYVQRAHG